MLWQSLSNWIKRLKTLVKTERNENMPNYTFPNQRNIIIHRERATSDFLGIKNENWMAASRDLGAHALRLYLYIAANRDGYELALSPAALRISIGMARSTYHDQFHILVDKGYFQIFVLNCCRPCSSRPINTLNLKETIFPSFLLTFILAMISFPRIRKSGIC